MSGAQGQAGGQIVSLPLRLVLTMVQLHEREGRQEEAAALLEHCLAAAPRNGDALHLAAIVAHRRGRQQEALRFMHLAIRHGDNTPLYYRNIAELYRLTGQLDAAENAARQAVALGPADPVALLNLGLVLNDRGRPEAAMACLEQSLALNPDSPAAHFGLAEALLVQGDLARGWEEYEWRFRLPGAGALLPKTTAPQWDGAPMPGRSLLLFADQGFGDGIQFGRYVTWAVARCGQVTLACSKQLRPVLSRLAPGLRVVSTWQQAGAFAAWCPLSGLPRLAGTTLATMPAAVPYLRADPQAAIRWRRRLDGLVAPGLRRIGLVWAGRPTHKNDARRSASLAALAPIAALPGIALVVLQKGPAQEQAGQYRGCAPLVHVSAEIADFPDTMAIMDGLDLVITVDTSVAHLAGAMGIPVWIMLPHVAEWRWLRGRDDSPWYPSARLFRQKIPGDWHHLAAEVADAISARPSTSFSRLVPHNETKPLGGPRRRVAARLGVLETS